MRTESYSGQKPDGERGVGPGTRRWTRRLILAGMVALVLFFARGPILTAVARQLVYDDPLEATDAVVILGRGGPYQAVPVDEAAKLYRDGLARAVLLIENRSSRIVQARIVPTLEEVLRKELQGREVPKESFQTLPREGGTEWDDARRLGEWLREHPDATATVLCDELHSRRTAYVFQNVLGPEAAARLRWRALPDRRFGPSDWWRSRHGTVEVLGAYASLLYAWAAGEPSVGTRWDPDEFEAGLRGRNE